MDVDDLEPTVSNLDPVYHFQYNASEMNGNMHLAEPNSTYFNNTAYNDGKPNWADDTVLGKSVKVGI